MLKTYSTMKENLHEPNCIRTNSGRYLNLLDPNPDDILIEDIAHGLSSISRFCGQLEHFYSVAQHSMIVCRMAAPEDRLEALLHDASEAYIGDIPSPLKRLLPDYYKIESLFMLRISQKFHFPYPLGQGVIMADKLALEQEWKLLFLNRVHGTMSPRSAKQQFLQMYESFIGPQRKVARIPFKFNI